MTEYDVTIDSVWRSDYGDWKGLANIYEISLQGEKSRIGTVTVSYDEYDISKLANNFRDDISTLEVMNAMRTLTLKEIDSYVNLPKLSECSPLLIELFNNVKESDNSMCWVDENDWNDIYDEYNNNDFKRLQGEISYYGLDDVIETDTKEYKIICYSDLETRFFDDLAIKNKDLKEDKEITVLYCEEGTLPKVMTIKDNLETKQELVKGFIEVITPFDDDVCIICNEEGKINGMLPNRALLDYDILFGPFIVVGDDWENAGFKSLTEDQLKTYSKVFDYSSIEIAYEMIYNIVVKNKKAKDKGRSL